jgi:hypothetical protein
MTPLTDSALRQAFDILCQTTTDISDFEWVSFQDGKQLYTRTFSVEQAAKLEIIGITGDGSSIACWHQPGCVAPSLPVVWIGSEGIASVFADSFADFLSLLPYGTGYIDDILFNYHLERSSPGRYAIDFTQASAHGALAANAEEHTDHFAYVEWLTHTAGLSIASDPVTVIDHARQMHSNFEQWMGLVN